LAGQIQGGAGQFDLRNWNPFIPLTLHSLFRKEIFTALVSLVKRTGTPRWLSRSRKTVPARRVAGNSESVTMMSFG
jgi:hypothetical protein